MLLGFALPSLFGSSTGLDPVAVCFFVFVFFLQSRRPSAASAHWNCRRFQRFQTATIKVSSSFVLSSFLSVFFWFSIWPSVRFGAPRALLCILARRLFRLFFFRVCLQYFVLTDAETNRRRSTRRFFFFFFFNFVSCTNRARLSIPCVVRHGSSLAPPPQPRPPPLRAFCALNDRRRENRKAGPIRRWPRPP